MSDLGKSGKRRRQWEKLIQVLKLDKHHGKTWENTI
jgi:hypothetical protein